MFIARLQSYFGGWEQLLVHKNRLSQDIVDAIEERSDGRSQVPSGSDGDVKSGPADRIEREFGLRGRRPKRSAFYPTSDEVRNLRLRALPGPVQKQILSNMGLRPIRRYDSARLFKDSVAVDVLLRHQPGTSAERVVARHSELYMRGFADVCVAVVACGSLAQEPSAAAWSFDAIADRIRQPTCRAAPVVLIGVDA